MLLGPIVWHMAVMLAEAEKGNGSCIETCDGSKLRILLVPPFVIIGLIIPVCAWFSLRKAKKAGAEIAARFGWLCAHYEANCYWWEIMTFQGRLLTMSALLFPQSISVAIYMVVTTTMLTLQLRFKPFLESKDEAAHWSSPNKQAVLCYIASLTFMTVGFLAQVSEPDSDSFASILLSFVAIAALLTPLAMSVIIVGQTYGCLSGGPNRDGTTAEYDVDTSDMDAVDNPVSNDDEKTNDGA